MKDQSIKIESKIDPTCPTLTFGDEDEKDYSRQILCKHYGELGDPHEKCLEQETLK